MAEYLDPAMDAIEDAAGTAAEDIYMEAIQSGASPSEAASAAIEAAGVVMTDMGAPPEMVDTMASAAQEGFDLAIDSGMSPMEAFDAARESVDSAFDDELPLSGDMGPEPDGLTEQSMDQSVDGLNIKSLPSEGRTPTEVDTKPTILEDDMSAMHSHMDDAAAHGLQEPGLDTTNPISGDTDSEDMMPPPPTDDSIDDDIN